MPARFAMLCRGALAAAALMVAATAHAQEFPSRTVRIVVPFAAGGSSDSVSRLIARKLTASMGQPFAPIIHVGTVNLMLVAHPSVPAKTVQELIQLARAKPGTVTYASPGSGTVGHLAGEMFRSTAKVDITHVPYKGSGPALTDLIGGQVSMLFANMPGTIQHVSAGRLNVLAVTSEKRSSLMPDVPTVAESGLDGYQATTWFGVLAPAGTPREVVAKLNAEIGKALASPDLIEHLRADGAEATGGSPEQFRAFLRAEIDRWAPVVKAAGAKAD